MATRSKGSGYLVERSPGVWRLRVELGTDPLTGRRQTVNETCRGTKKVAQTRLNQLLAEHAGKAVSSITVGDLVALWQRTAEHRTETAKTYAYALKHMPTKLTERKARDVRLIEVEQIYRSLSDAGVSVHMIAKLQSALHTAYSNGVRLGLVPSNPVAGARTPKIAKRAPTMPTADVVAKVLDAAVRQDLQFGVWLDLAAMTGARRGELIALTWDAVDLDRGLIIIRQSISKGGEVNPTKNEKTRRVPIDDTTVSLLQEWRAAQHERAHAAGVQLADNPFVLSNTAASNQPWRADGATQLWRRLADRLQVDKNVRLNDLRHAHQSILLDSGEVGLPTVRDLAGHSAVSQMTLERYGHSNPTSMRAAIGVLRRTIESSDL